MALEKDVIINPTDEFSIRVQGTSQYKTVTYYTLFKKIFGNITFPEVPTPEPGVDETLDTVTTRGNITANTIEVGGVTTNYTLYNTAYVAALQAGMTAWNDIDGTLDIRLKGNHVTLQVGQEEVIRVVNKTGANLLESQYRVVRVRTAAEGGAQGQRLAVLLAQANTKANHTGILGLVTENIDNNQEGFVTAFGFIRNINTTGSLQGETWADGDALWLSATVAGGVTNVEPSQHPVQLGYVTYAHVNNGKIFVKLENGVDELAELHDVTFSTPPTNGQFLVYNSTLSAWENQSGSSAGIVSGSGTATQVAFWNTSSSISSDSNLYWDNALKNLGIGTATPIEKLVVSNAGAEGFEFQPSTGRFYRFDRVGMAYGGIYEEASEYTWSIGPSEKMRLDSSGNLGINTSNTGYGNTKLTVYGDMTVGNASTGNMNFSLYGDDGYEYVEIKPSSTPGLTVLNLIPSPSSFMGPFAVGIGADASSLANPFDVLIVGGGNSIFYGPISAPSVDASVLKQNGIRVDIIAITYAIALG